MAQNGHISHPEIDRFGPKVVPKWVVFGGLDLWIWGSGPPDLEIWTSELRDLGIWTLEMTYFGPQFGGSGDPLSSLRSNG